MGDEWSPPRTPEPPMPAAPPVPPGLTPAQAAARAGRSENTIRRWVHAGLLPAERVGPKRLLRIAAADVDAVLAPQPVVVGKTGSGG